MKLNKFEVNSFGPILMSFSDDSEMANMGGLTSFATSTVAKVTP